MSVEKKVKLQNESKLNTIQLRLKYNLTNINVTFML